MIFSTLTSGRYNKLINSCHKNNSISISSVSSSSISSYSSGNSNNSSRINKSHVNRYITYSADSKSAGQEFLSL